MIVCTDLYDSITPKFNYCSQAQKVKIISSMGAGGKWKQQSKVADINSMRIAFLQKPFVDA
jgi:tRNA A37 threonylcarbamoyladenosine dehydratase